MGITRSRTQSILTPVSPEEKRKITQNAQRHGLSVAAWLRFCGLRTKIKGVIDDK